jgi:hypothetical protein
MSNFKDTLESKSYLKYLESKHSNKYGNSSFWMDGLVTRKEDSADKFDLIKMAQYQRAISNFVKIVSRKDIPVKFNSADSSYTDGKTEVVISGNVNEKSFDATAGLALHEASHIIYTDFDLLPKYFRPYIGRLEDMYDGMDTQCAVKAKEWSSYIVKNMDAVSQLKGFDQTLIFGLSNWIEDRRIDNLVFKSSPGYKSYYHTLYEKYYLSDTVTKMLQSSEYREENVASYKARIVGLINPASDRNALVGLRNIINLIDLHNIDRLKSTEDSIELSFRVADMIAQYCLKYKEQPQPSQTQPQPQSQPQSQPEEGQGQPQASNGEGNDPEDGDTNPNDDGEKADGDKPSTSDGNGPMSDRDMNKLQKVMEEIEQLIQGKPKKTKLTSQNNRIVKSIAGNVDTSVDTVTYEGHQIAILHVRLSPNMIRNYVFDTPVAHSMDSTCAGHLKEGKHWSIVPEQQSKGWSWTGRHLIDQADIVKKGLALGTQLGKKLQVRDQVRDTRFNRLKTGKIDSRLLYQCGYDVMNIFEQVKFDKYTPSILDISVDASSSMTGSKWNNTQIAILAIAKAASMIQNLRVKVSYRYNPRIGKRDGVMFLDAYDSNRDKIKHMEDVVFVLRPDNCTVDSLVTAYQLKKKLIIPGSTEVKSYFLNFSDGGPGATVGETSYGGMSAHQHIAKCRRDIEALGVKVMSYFIGKDNEHGKKQFNEDWGVQNAAFIDVTEVLPLAKSLNNMFLSK